MIRAVASPRGAGDNIVRDRILTVPWVFRAVRGILDPGQIDPLRRFLAQVPHDSLLDIGCGLGTLSRMTDQRYTGLDAVPDYIDYAESHFGAPTKRFVVGDAFNLDPGLGRFHVVALVNFIHHFSDDEVGRILTGLRGVSPAHVMVVDVALDRAGPLFHRVLAPLDRGAHFRSRSDQRALLEGAGCRIEREAGYRSRNRLYPHSILLAGY
jgi:SAM-dependent methyltransferase